jgi:hypothetical protein
MTNSKEIKELIERLENILDDFYSDEGVDPLEAKNLFEDSKIALQDYQAMIDRVEDRDTLAKYMQDFIPSESNILWSKITASRIQKYIRGEV